MNDGNQPPMMGDPYEDDGPEPYETDKPIKFQTNGCINLCGTYKERYGSEPPEMLKELERWKKIRSTQVAALAIVTAAAIEKLRGELLG